MCLEKEFENDQCTASKINNAESLIQIPDGQRKKLANCINKPNKGMCTRFLIISDKVCEDKVFYPYPAPSNVSNDAQRDQNVRRRKAIQSPNIASNDKRTHSFGPDLPQVKRRKSRSLNPSSDQIVSADSNPVVTFVAVQFEVELCLACYILVHEMLLVYFEAKYAWMVK
uniref:AlNc14C56G4277 protein n=1 Tax=Albugo laibachii Nc14 TaxID=890382 RepID=F0WC94_9STRA|nr:AlNc14C56G4277 [Albugo laibachii Nc14]|eukprot:CCA18807.1 AlNc14C56G4277 [Albugo laibachii Nc14]